MPKKQIQVASSSLSQVLTEDEKYDAGNGEVILIPLYLTLSLKGEFLELSRAEGISLSHLHERDRHLSGPASTCRDGRAVRIPASCTITSAVISGETLPVIDYAG